MEKIGNAQKNSTRAIFFIGGFTAASWAPLVPVLRERLFIEEDLLGMLLLCVGIGSLLTMPISGALASRFGCRKVLTVASILMSIMLLLLCKIPNFGLAVVAVLFFGAIMGCIDVSMNIQSVVVEKAVQNKIMSGMHAMYSVGGFFGAGLFGVWVGILKLTPFQSTLIAALIVCAILLKFSSQFISGGGEKGGKLIALPKGILIFVGFIAMISYLIEGAIMDWGGVFLTITKGFDISVAGVGFAMFSASMLLMRFVGDSLVEKFGARFVVLCGCVIALAGFLFLIFAESQKLLFAGFFLIGSGAANIVPIFFSMLGSQKIMPVNMAIPAVSTLGYLGILMGPAVIGFIAKATSLYFAFGLLAGLVIIELLISNYVCKKVVKV